MNRLTTIRVLSDGRAGHENQSIGLAEALARRTGASWELLRFAPGAPWWARCRQAVAAGGADLFIGTGHGTHLPLWWAGRRARARTILIMKPTLPTWFFDLCLIPRHDLRGRIPPDGGRIVATMGALNRLPETLGEKAARGLVLLGGPSAHHGWDATSLLANVGEVLRARPDLAWTVADSRRTPEGTLDQLRATGLRADFVPHTATAAGWLPAQLAAAAEAWVTEDSVSMLHEAVTAGARTGVLPVPRRRETARVVRSVEALVAEGHATWLADWAGEGRHLPPPKLLHETGRCADVIIARFFSEARRA